MKWRTFAVVVGVATAVALFIFAPVVHSPYELLYSGDPLALHFPAYESPSCFLLGWGMTYKATPASMGQVVVANGYLWTYYLGCPPSVINITGPMPR